MGTVHISCAKCLKIFFRKSKNSSEKIDCCGIWRISTSFPPMIFHSSQSFRRVEILLASKNKISMNIKANIIRPNRSGFTLIEILVVLIILGVLASVVQSKFVDLGDNTENRAIEVGIMGLNAREKLTWTDFKLSSSGWTNDNAVFATMDMNLGAGYSWIAGPANSGGTLQFKSKSVVLIRTSSTDLSAGQWK